ncbi:MAG: hypothetical protein ABIJ96_11990 [Elusimicrobiota bacterium]
MKRGDAAHLLSALAEYGYSLLSPEATPDPNDVLARMTRSRDTRVLEGFPVVLVNASDRHPNSVDLERAESLLKNEVGRAKFRQLVMLAALLCEGRDESLAWLVKKPKWLKETALKKLRGPLARNEPLVLTDGMKLDPERLKNTFFEYARGGRAAEQSEADKSRLGEEMRKEYYLSLLLTPRQKELLHKKLRGEKMSKTEREYFSRVVKKKLRALADPDLHRLAQKALQ